MIGSIFVVGLGLGSSFGEVYVQATVRMKAAIFPGEDGMDCDVEFLEIPLSAMQTGSK